MDNTALELTAAILWSLGVIVLPTLSILIGGGIGVYVFGSEAGKAAVDFVENDADPGKALSKITGKGMLTLLVSLVIGLVLAVVAIWNAVEAWVAFAS